jgi:sRNA-binding carbon storage regulator CsrA
VMDVFGQGVRLGITAPGNVAVLRHEVYGRALPGAGSGASGGSVK